MRAERPQHPPCARSRCGRADCRTGRCGSPSPMPERLPSAPANCSGGGSIDGSGSLACRPRLSRSRNTAPGICAGLIFGCGIAARRPAASRNRSRRRRADRSAPSSPASHSVVTSASIAEPWLPARRIATAGILAIPPYMRAMDPKHLGQASSLPASPEEAVLDYVPNPRPGGRYLVRFTAPEFTSLCPVTGQPDFAHLVIDYVPGETIVESKSLKLFLGSFRNHAGIPRGLHRRDRRAADRRDEAANGCGSAAIGIRAAASRSTCSGSRGRRPRASGCRRRTCPAIAAAAESAHDLRHELISQHDSFCCNAA